MAFYSVSLTNADHFGQIASADLSAAFAAMSVSVWYKGTDTESSLFGTLNHDGAGTGFFVQNDTGDTGIEYSPDPNPSVLESFFTSDSPDNFPDGSWHNLVLTYGPTPQVLWYKDGLLVPTTNVDGGSHISTYTSTTNFYLGSSDSSYTKKGNYAYLQFFDRILTPTEITTIAAGNLGANPKGEWKFTEGSGVTAADTSGNAYTMTFNVIDAWSVDVPFTPSSGPTAQQKASMFLVI